jgi:heme a synthase
VIVQGVLGGLTVIYLLPAPISIGHAGLAQLFFCLMLGLAVFTSKNWRTQADTPDDPILRRVAVTTAILIYLQILVGATMRHTGAGLAIPDFPLAFGGLLPPEWTTPVAIHFAHRVGAVVAIGRFSPRTRTSITVTRRAAN